MPLLAALVLQTLRFLAHTVTKIVSIDVRKNGCGNCRVSGPVEDRNCLCELVVGTSLSLSKRSLSLQSETSECVSAYNSHKYIILQNIPMQSHDCNLRKIEYLNE
jgi:hypothetical protein